MAYLPVPSSVLREERLAFIRTTAEDQTILPVPHPTKSFWINSSPDANPHAKEGSTDPLTEDADICIIGSGITGVSAAYWLARSVTARKGGAKTTLQKPFKIVILEARDFCPHYFSLHVAYFI